MFRRDGTCSGFVDYGAVRVCTLEKSQMPQVSQQRVFPRRQLLCHEAQNPLLPAGHAPAKQGLSGGGGRILNR